MKDELNTKDLKQGPGHSESFYQEALAEKIASAEKNIGYVRGAVVVFNSLIYFLMDKTGSIPWLAMSIILLGWLYFLAVIYYQPYRKYVIASSYVLTCLDVLIITAWLYSTGGFDSPFYPLYYISIIAVAFRFSAKTTLLVSTLYALCYSGLLLALNEFSGHEFEAMTRLGYIYLIGFLSILITHETFRQTQQKIHLTRLVDEANLVQEKLKTQTRVYETLLKAQSEMGEGVMISEDSKLAYVNEAFCRITGYKKEDFTAIPNFFALLAPEIKEELQEEFKRKQLPEHSEASLITKSGKHISIAYSLKAVQSGNVTQLIAIIRDVTDKKRAEENLKIKSEELKVLNNELERKVKQRTQELQESVEKFQSLIEAIPQMAWTSLPSGEIVYLNKAWKNFTGASDIAGWNWEKYIYPSDRKRTFEKWAHSLTTGEPYEIEYRWIRYDGKPIWMLGRANPINNSKGEIILWIGTATDIHEQKMQQDKKDEFIGLASHELKTPLTSAKAYVQLINKTLEMGSTKDVKQFIMKTDTFICRLETLISDLLDVSKIQAGKLNYNVTEFDFDEMVYETLDNIQHTSIKHKIVTEGKCHTLFKGDKQRLEQVISNYLLNAIKYSPYSSEVKVKLEKLDDRLQVAVTDFGIGIPRDKISHIWDRFYRVDNFSHGISGLGIGLFLSKEIVSRHGGKVWAESEEGKGSTFYFSLPVR